MASTKKLESLIQQGAEFQARGDFAAAGGCYRKALKAAPNHPQALWMLGMLELGMGRVDSGARHMERLLRLQPQSTHSHCGMAQVRVAQGRMAEARAGYQRAVSLDGANLPALVGLGALLAQEGDLEGAEATLRRAVAVDPRAPEVRIRLGGVLSLLNREEEAGAEYEAAADLAPNLPITARVLTRFCIDWRLWQRALHMSERWIGLEPENVDAHVAHGVALLNLQQVDRAESAFDKGLSLDPGAHTARIGKCDVLRLRGDMQAACQMVEPLLSDENPSGALLAYAGIAEGMGRRDDALARIDEALRGDRLPEDLRRDLHFAAGELLDKKKDYDRAFEHYREGNRMSPGTFDPEIFRQFVDRQIEVFDPAAVGRLARASGHLLRPVLIVGMPRSGTTLVEQVLSSHPQAHGAGELEHISRIAHLRAPALSPTRREYPECVRDLTRDELDRLAREYDTDLARMGGEALRVTDKQPLNCLHLGLIHLMLPHVRVIHCRRNPVDTCLSNYFQNFSSLGLAYSRDLSHLGFYYRQYDRLMAHWRETLDLQVLEVDYEEMVADQEGMSRKLVAFVGLEWDDACLQFHKTKRTVSTASATQVRQPMYKGSVERWRRYEKHLAPLLEALGIRG
ncbi:MAG: sulfotransferase [Nitrospirota bacterium]|nr:sulfotransferase [Nitrospirota bacterium]